MEHVASREYHELKNRLFRLLRDYALEHREVTLVSGQKSHVYLDCRQVYFRGEAHFLIGELFWEKMLVLENEYQTFGACGGMAMGSIPLSLALSAAAFRRGRELPGFAVRKEIKPHGMQAVIEGNKCLKPKTHVVIVEDVVTTGGSALKAIEELRNAGVVVNHMLSIVDRQQGGSKHLLEARVKLESIFRLEDF